MLKTVHTLGQILYQEVQEFLLWNLNSRPSCQIYCSCVGSMENVHMCH